MKFNAYFINPSAKFIPTVNEYERHESYQVFGAKCEHVSFQIVIEAFEDLRGICVKAEPFRSDADKYEQIDAYFMKMHTISGVYLSCHTKDVENIISEEPGMYPDPLDICKPLSLKKGEFQNILITVDIPAETKAGDYNSYILIHTSNTEKMTIYAKLHVYDFILDAPLFEITRWPNIGNIPRMHNAPLGSDRFFEGVDRIAVLLRQYGESIIFVPWNELELFERCEDGEVRVNSWIMRKYISTFKNRGFRKFAYRHISWRDAWKTTYALGWPLKISGAGKDEYTDTCDFFDPRYLDLITKHMHEIQAIADADEDGCEYFTHIFDEPVKYHNEIYMKLCDFVHETAPSMKLIEAMRSANLDTYDRLDACVSLWGTDLELKDQIHGDFYWYICMEPKGGYSNRFIDQNPACYRSVPWLMWLYDIKGYLEWGLNYYGDGVVNNAVNCDPRENPCMTIEVIDPNGMVTPPGDGFLMYPDNDRYYMPSLRLEIFMAGLQEYKYLKMLEKLAKNGRKPAKALLEDVRAFLKDTLNYSKDLNEYDGMKKRIGDELEKALS